MAGDNGPPAGWDLPGMMGNSGLPDGIGMLVMAGNSGPPAGFGNGGNSQESRGTRRLGQLVRMAMGLGNLMMGGG